jgi:hypothetical protein
MLDRPPRKGTGSVGQAERTRRYRRRQANGRAVYPVEADGDVVGLLIRLHWLDERDASDKAAVGRAIARMLADAARR